MAVGCCSHIWYAHLAVAVVAGVCFGGLRLGGWGCGGWARSCELPQQLGRSSGGTLVLGTPGDDAAWG